MLDPNNIDFQGLGFRAGLEIHHQLRSKRKLFCNCPADLDQELQKTPQFVFHRRFRAVMGEMGDFDPGMLVEVEKGYLVIYHANDEHVCTYEMDETPPFWPDQKAIDIGFLLTCLFNCESPVEELVVNRKQYLDGSITTGFQRTLIVGRDGHVQLLNGKKVPITNILVEEDAARKIKTEDRGRTVYYNLDRLGVPLTEIITDHKAIDTPEELVETAYMIGLNMRTTGLVKRGLGAARQDVNISIDGGDRVEIKGIQDLAMLPKWCAHEVCRQHAFIEMAERIATLGLKKEDFEHTYVDISHLFNDLGEGESAYTVRLPGFQELLLTEVQPGKDFGYEIFEKNNLITGIQYNEMFHSGEITDGSFRKKVQPEQLFVDNTKNAEIRNILNLEEGDGYITARGPEKPVLHSLKKSVERCKQAFIGVPQETRRALPNGNNEFLRVIHGMDRLYPDTDTPPEPYPWEKYEKIKTEVKPRPLELLSKYKDKGLSWNNLTLLIRDERTALFQQMVDENGVGATLAVRLLIELPRWASREGVNPSDIHDNVLLELGKSGLPNSALRPLFLELAKSNSKEEQLSLINTKRSEVLDDSAVRDLARKKMEEIKTSGADPDKARIIGPIMKEHGAKVNGAVLSRIVEELL